MVITAFRSVDYQQAWVMMGSDFLTGNIDLVKMRLTERLLQVIAPQTTSRKETIIIQ